jgi:hypothetical protein
MDRAQVRHHRDWSAAYTGRGRLPRTLSRAMLGAMTEQKITFGEMRDMGVRGITELLR